MPRRPARNSARALPASVAGSALANTKAPETAHSPGSAARSIFGGFVEWHRGEHPDGSDSIAEPLLASNLIFALILAAILSRQRVTKTELIGAVVLSAGVAALALTRAPNSDTVSFGSFTYWPAAAGVGLIAYGLIQAGRRRLDGQRAILAGIAAGLVFGIGDALTRRTMQLVTSHEMMVLFTSWPIYCLVAVGFVGFLLMESAFNAGPLRASLPGIAAAEPVSGILLGIVVFGDPVFMSPGMLALRAAGVAALIIGVVLVARAPVLCGPRLVPDRHGLTVAQGAGTAGRQQIAATTAAPTASRTPTSAVRWLRPTMRTSCCISQTTSRAAARG